MYITIMRVTKLNFLKKIHLNPTTVFVGVYLLLLSLTSHAQNSLDLGCLTNYQSLLKSVDSLEVSALPEPLKIKMTGVKSYSGELPPQCQGQTPPGAVVKIFTLNNKLYSLDITVKTSKPYFSQFISIKEVSRMEVSLRQNNYAVSTFTTGIDKGLSLGYQIEFVVGGFVEHLSYRSLESAKYE